MKRDPAPEGAAFESTHRALVFAFNETDRGGRELNILAKLGMPAGGGDGTGGPLARAGQAGMVLAEVNRLPSVSRQILTASYTDRGTWCPICKHGEANPRWIEALEWLAFHLEQTALAHAHADIGTRRAIVMRFFVIGKERLKIEDLAAACGIDRNTASRHVSQANKQLKRDHSTAFHQIDAKLQELGIVGQVSVD